MEQMIEKLKAQQEEAFNNMNVMQTIFNCIDLTTLKQTDTRESVRAFVEKVNRFGVDYPMYPNVGGICVYPNFAKVVTGTLNEDKVRRAVVAGGFPSSQTYSEIKALESRLAVENGATEVDIVIAVGEMLEGEEEYVASEIRKVKEVIGDVHLKVILETGVLVSPDVIRRASEVAIEAGADFIKTSTGKEAQGDMVTAAVTMCSVIKEHFIKTNKMIGFKPAGGIRTAYDATLFYLIVKEILGEKWLQPDLFRIGASSLANSVLSRMETLRTGTEQEIKYF